MPTLEQERILLDCLDAMVEAEEDANDSGEESDDDDSVDDVALDHAYEIACLEEESHKATVAILTDQVARIRRINVCSWMHGARSILTCLGAS
jgi:hypothetical protein